MNRAIDARGARPCLARTNTPSLGLALGLFAASAAAAGEARADVTGALPLAGDGASLQWSPSTGTTHASLLGTSACASGTYVASGGVGSRDSYRVSIWTVPMGAVITGVELTPCFAAGAEGASGTASVFYRMNNLASADAGVYLVSSTTPAFGAATSFSGLSVVRSPSTVLEAGVVLAGGAGPVRLAGLSVKVTYTPAAVLGAPTGLAASAGSAARIDLRWTSNSGGTETGFRLERSPGTGFTLLANVGSGVSAYADLGVSAGATYTYRVLAYNQATGQTSAYSNEASAGPAAAPDAGVAEDTGVAPDTGVAADTGAELAADAGATSAGGLDAGATDAGDPPFTPFDVAITVDDFARHGPEIPGLTREATFLLLLDTLRAHGVPGAYGFVNTVNVAPSDRTLLQLWLDAGYGLGNHTYDHPDLWAVGPAAYIDDIDQGEAILRDVVGADREAAWKVFRYTFGHMGSDLASRDQVKQHLADRGYRIAWSSLEWQDWLWNTTYPRCVTDAQKAALRASQRAALAAWVDWITTTEQALFGRSIKHVLTIHVGGFTALMADELLTDLERRGARFISLDEALQDPVYTDEPPLLTTYDQTFLSQVRLSRRRLDLPPAPAPTDMASICP